MNEKLNNCYDFLKERGFLYQSTNEESVKQLLTKSPTVIYFGIDPTADSLHIGHCFPLFLLKHLQKAGHKIIILIGGATALIGDPTGKSDMRKMIDKSFVMQNVGKIKKVLNHFLSHTGKNPYKLVNNYDWYKNYSYINFMREIGVHFNVNKMLATDAYTKRMSEGGLTFFEMGYMLMQAYDFVFLNEKFSCQLEIGGQDQWANMLAGCELARKLKGEKINMQALTLPLLTTADGKKMGKTENGAIWVDESKTSPFEFYQHFYNVSDDKVEFMLKTMTNLSLEKIEKLMKDDILSTKKIMAYEITKMVHGKKQAEKAIQTAKNLFYGNDYSLSPSSIIKKDMLPINICTLCAEINLTSSTSEARKLIMQQGLSINDKKVSDYNLMLTNENFSNGFVMLKKGKKTFIKVVLK